MQLDHARRLLDRIDVLRRPCDLDLLIFFARHPRTLLTSEQLAAFLGYEIKQIAESLDVLLGAGFLTWSRNPTHAARMYTFVPDGTNGGWLPALLQVVSTRAGRLAMMRALTRRTPEGTSGPVARLKRETKTESATRSLRDRRKRDRAPRSRVG